MGFMSSFFGSDQRRDVQRAKGRADAALTEGVDRARAGYSSATGRLNPYAASGSAANAMYADAIGLHGRGPQSTVVGNFMADPFREENETLANENLARQFNGRAGPGTGSGAFALATARGNLERGSADYNRWLDRVAGVGSQGLQAAGAQSGIDVGGAEMEYGAGATRAGNEINFGNAMAASRSTGINNILGLAGTVVKGFTPGWGGKTAFGNMYNAMRGA